MIWDSLKDSITTYLMFILFKSIWLLVLKLKDQDLLIWLKALGMSEDLGDRKLLLLFPCK